MSVTIDTHMDIYKLIVGQLRADGYNDAAAAVSKATLANASTIPSTRLAHIAKLGAQSDERQRALAEMSKPAVVSDAPAKEAESNVEAESTAPVVTMIDFDNADPSQPISDALAPKEVYKSSHRGFIKSTCFSSDGRYVVSACTASLIKIYDVNAAVGSGDVSGNDSTAIVSRILDHQSEINDLAFHPNGKFLVSCSTDESIRIYDIKKGPSANKPIKKIQDSHPILSFGLHPSGNFLAAGTSHAILRIYDINTSQCYTNQNPMEHHTAPITQVRYNSSGAQYVSGCKAGEIRIWDGVSGKCVMDFDRSHDGTSITSLQFSKNDKYLLSCGRNDECRLWDLRMGRVLNVYQGAKLQSAQGQCCFSMDEQQIYVIDDESHNLVSWDTATSVKLNSISSNDVQIGGTLSQSPVSNLIVTGSSDKTDNAMHLWKLEPFDASTEGASTEGAGEAEGLPVTMEVSGAPAAPETSDTSATLVQTSSAPLSALSAEEQCKLFLETTEEPDAKRIKTEPEPEPESEPSSNRDAPEEASTPPGTPPQENLLNA